MELSDLYSQRMLELAANLPESARLDAPDASARRASRVCGSVIEVDLSLENGVVSAFSQDVNACALGQTSASIMAQNITGSTPDELRLVRAQMYTMLKEDGTPPNHPKWIDLKYLEPIRDYPARHTSTLLVFDAVVDCLDQIEGTAR